MTANSHHATIRREAQRLTPTRTGPRGILAARGGWKGRRPCGAATLAGPIADTSISPRTCDTKKDDPRLTCFVSPRRMEGRRARLVIALVVMRAVITTRRTAAIAAKGSHREETIVRVVPAEVPLPGKVKSDGGDCGHRPRLEPLEGRIVLSTFQVNTTLDTVAVDLRTGKDATGHISLRSAIMAADAKGGSNTISLKSGTYTLTIAGANEDASATGDLDITSNLTIKGAGSSSTIIDGNSLDRVIEVLHGKVNISGVTIENGVANDGAGLMNLGGQVTLSSVVVTAEPGRRQQWRSGRTWHQLTRRQRDRRWRRQRRHGRAGGGIFNGAGVL